MTPSSRSQAPSGHRTRRRAAAMLFAAAALTAGAARADINIGVLLSLTGPGASLGIPENDTVKLWPQTIGNEKVVVTVLNDNSDPTTAAVAARKLITENKVDLIVGSSLTPPSLAMVGWPARARCRCCRWPAAARSWIRPKATGSGPSSSRPPRPSRPR